MMPLSFSFLQGQVYLGPGVGNSLLAQFAEALNYPRHLGQRDTHEHQIVAYIGGAPAAIAAKGDVDLPGRERDDGRLNAQCVVAAHLEVEALTGVVRRAHAEPHYLFGVGDNDDHIRRMDGVLQRRNQGGPDGAAGQAGTLLHHLTGCLDGIELSEADIELSACQLRGYFRHAQDVRPIGTGVAMGRHQ